MRLPMTAKEQLLLAREQGHELSIVERTRDDFPEAPPKYWLHCTCGYSSTARRSRSALNGLMAWHLGKAISDAFESRSVNGG